MLVIIELKVFFDELVDDWILTLDLFCMLISYELVSDDGTHSVVEIVPDGFEGPYLNSGGLPLSSNSSFK